MLSLSIHASSPEKADRFNRLARVDIVYEHLAPVADYKVSLLERNQDVRPPRTLPQYPRWSASLWDLTARAIALSLPDEPPANDQVPEFEPGGKRCAFIREMCAILDHAANDSRNTLGSAHIKQAGRRRGCYMAAFDEHTLKPHRTEPFVFAPAYFRPAELLVHACLHRLTSADELPPRPGLCAPSPVIVEGTLHVHFMDRLARNLDDLRRLVRQLNEKGVIVKFHKEALIFTGEQTPMANLLLSMLGAVLANAKASPWPRLPGNIGEASRS